MKSTQFIDSTLDILQSKQSVSERYHGDIEWLKERKGLWGRDKIRVGVLGVTSSGKSTLINAVIGMELLSTAVRPTSGQLVSCCKGDKPEARISFKTSRDLVLQDRELRLENIRRYSDENENHKNKENVTSISISTPGFDLGDIVELIDSAGLDAYMLEAHEKLSLEILLPTIDMCIFVTTLKASSDQKTRSVLNSVANHDCPLLLVQNMLDSVEPSADGKKSKEQVAEEHKTRLKRIIDSSEIKDKSSVHVVQFSARYAMLEKCRNEKENDDSHYSEFKAIVDGMIKEIIPNIDNDRCRTIAARYGQLINSEEKALSGKLMEKPIFQYDGLKEKLKNNICRFDKELEASLFDLGAKHGSNNSSQSLNTIQQDIERSEKVILSVITSANSYISDMAKQLNTPLRELIVHINLEKITKPKEVLKTETERRKVGKEGFWSGIGRFFGELFGNDDWGYEYKNCNIETIDKARTTEEIGKYIERTHRAHTNTIKSWRNSLQITLDNIYSIIDKEFDIFKTRQKEIENAADVIDVLNALKPLILAMNLSEKKGLSKGRAAYSGVKKNNAKLYRVAISQYQKSLFDISKNFLHFMSKTALENCIKEIDAPSLKIVLGWDVDSIRDFMIRYMGICIDEEALWEKGHITVQDVMLALSPSDVQLNKIKKNSSASIFIMVNAQQDGSARNQISKLALKDNLKPEDKVFFVVQDFCSLVNSGGISEMKLNLYEYYREFEITKQKGLILINDGNPLYNLAFVQDQLEPCKSMQEEQELLELLKKFRFLYDPKSSKNIGDLIRNNRMEAYN